MKIYGRLYDETPNYYSFDGNHYFPYFTCIYEREWEVDFTDVDEGERWLIDNFPEYYMGSSIIGNNGDFICNAVPGVEYGKGNFETVKARVEYAKWIRDRRVS